MTKIRNLKIFTKILIIFIICFSVIILAAMFIFWKLSDRRMNQLVEQTLNYDQKAVELVSDQEAKTFLTALEVASVEPTIAQLFLTQKREELYDYAKPIFNSLQEKYNIGQWLFVSLDDKVFLRVQDKNNFGDLIKDEIFKAAQISGDFSFGIAPEGATYFLKAVQPYYHQGKLLGYLVMTKEINHFLKTLQYQSNLNLAFFVDKASISESDWNSLKTKQGFSGNWQDYRRYVLAGQTGNTALTRQCFNEQKVLAVQQDKNNNLFTSNGVFYACTLFKYKDFLTSQSFYFLFLREANSIGQVRSEDFSVLLFFVFVILLTIFILTWWIARLFVNPLRLLQQNIRHLEEGGNLESCALLPQDEIGDLAKEFYLLNSKLNDYNAKIEKTVIEQTKELINKQRKMEQEERAILNILEDVEMERDNSIRLAAIVRDSNDAIFSEDTKGIVKTWNQGAERLFGYTAAEMIDHSIEALIPEEKRDDFLNALAKIKKGERLTRVEVARKVKNGEVIQISQTVSPLIDASQNIIGLSIIARDITREKEIDRAKTEFVSLASHQLRTPLTAINWYIEMLMAGDAGKLNKEQKKFVKEVLSASKRMVDLVNALLNVSRIEMGTYMVEPTAVKLKEIAQDVIKEQQPQIIKKKIRVKEEYDKNLPVYQADPKLVRIIFQNLISNALKYSPSRSAVSVLIKLIENQKSAKPQENKILISVADQGYGIPEKDKEKIFTKLFRADNVLKKEVEGNGLGLYLVKSIVDNAGGKVWFDSTENKGTTFYIELPGEGMKYKAGTKTLI